MMMWGEGQVSQVPALPPSPTPNSQKGLEAGQAPDFPALKTRKGLGEEVWESGQESAPLALF